MLCCVEFAILQFEPTFIHRIEWNMLHLFLAPLPAATALALRRSKM